MKLVEIVAVLLPLFVKLSEASSSFSHEVKREWLVEKKEGDKVPDVNFLTRVRLEDSSFDWKTMTTADYFSGKRVVIFSLPGAFTPTCSSTHLPGYEEAYDEIKANGIDEVYCKWTRQS